MMRVIGVIPARYGSTRFEGKVLAELFGKPMIQHVWERSRKAKLLDDLVIACDDLRILNRAKEFGAKAVLTSPHHISGSDRIAEAVKNLKADIVVNIQGDEPLIHPSIIDGLAKALLEDKTYSIATVVKVIQDQSDITNPNVVKVVIDSKGDALYFSRATIPYNRDEKNSTKVQYFKHLGLYAYRKNFLLSFKKLPKSRLETIEKLEQLRVLEAGYKIKTVVTKKEAIGVDTPDDLRRVEEFLKREFKK